jgi:hypothetical protein
MTCIVKRVFNPFSAMKPYCPYLPECVLFYKNGIRTGSEAFFADAAKSENFISALRNNGLKTRFTMPNAHLNYRYITFRRKHKDFSASASFPPVSFKLFAVH